MLSIQEHLQRDINNNKSIAWWAKGFYISKGGEHGFDLKIPFFAFNNNIDELKPNDTTKVLVDYLGSMVWVNVLVHWLHYGYGVENSPSKEGKLIRYQLENLKN